MRQKGLFLIVLMILVAFVIPGRVEVLPAAEGLSRAIETVGATATELRVDGWCRLPRSVVRDADLTAIVKAGMAGLGIEPSQYRIICGDTWQQQRMVRALAEFGDNRHCLKVVVRVIGPAAASVDSGIYMITVQQASGQKTAAEDWQKEITAALGQEGEQVQINTCLVGYLDGKLEKGQWRGKLADASRSLGVTTLDTLVQPEFASATGFSPMFPEGVRAGDKLVNLNVAIRFSPYENRTYVIAGSPAISGEY